MRYGVYLTSLMIGVLILVLLLDNYSRHSQPNNNTRESDAGRDNIPIPLDSIDVPGKNVDPVRSDAIGTQPEGDFLLLVNAKDGSGAPLPGVAVAIESLWGDVSQMPALTDAAGKTFFQFDNPAVVRVVGTRHGAASIAGPIAITSHMPQEADLVFASCVGLRVRVVDDRGNPVDGARVSIGSKPLISNRTNLDDVAMQKSRTGADGIAEFSRVPDSVAYICVLKTGLFAPVATIRTPPEGGEHTIVMVMGETVGITVMDERTDMPIARIAVHVNIAESAIPSPEHNTGILITDEQGTVEFSRPNDCLASCYIRGEVEYHGYGLIDPGVVSYKLLARRGGEVRCVLVPHGVVIPSMCSIEYCDGDSSDYTRRTSDVTSDNSVTVEHQGTRTSPRFRIRVDGGSSKWHSFRGRMPVSPLDVHMYPDVSLTGAVLEHGTDLALGSCIVSAIDILDTPVSFISPPIAKCVMRTVTDSEGRFELWVPPGRLYELKFDCGIYGQTSAQSGVDSAARHVDVGRVCVDNSASLRLALTRKGRPVASCFGWIACHDLGHVESSALTTVPTPSFRTMFCTDAAGVATIESMPSGRHVVLIAGPSALPPERIPGSFFQARLLVDTLPGDNGIHKLDL